MNFSKKNLAKILHIQKKTQKNKKRRRKNVKRKKEKYIMV